METMTDGLPDERFPCEVEHRSSLRRSFSVWLCLAICWTLQGCNGQHQTTSAFTTVVDASISSSSGPGGATESSGSGSTSTSTQATTTEDSAASATTSSGSTPVTDVGWETGTGDTKPIGCQGKIDFLFVLEGSFVLEDVQPQLIDAFPKFIETIEAKFADFDYHIMVVEADWYWGVEQCSADCPLLGCKVGEACCSWGGVEGEPCCPSDYPCDAIESIDACDETIGAGTVTPAGFQAANMRCKIANGRRYMAKGQPQIAETFACAAQIGLSGDARIGDAVVAATSQELNGAGGCNEGFLRDDALLMVTVVGSGIERSKTWIYPWDWYDSVLEAKHDEPESVVALYIGNDYCPVAGNYPCQFVKMFPRWVIEDFGALDYSVAFGEATGLIEDACEDFIPQ